MTDLRQRRLGPSGPYVTVLGYGAMELRGTPHRSPRPLDESVVEEVLRTVLDEGITFVDTSIDYGLSEELIGKFIGSRRDEFVLASKVGCPLDHQPDAPRGTALVHDYSPQNIRAGVEQSLRRLRTDYLDLVQIHGDASLKAVLDNEAIGTLSTLRDEGLIRDFGTSSKAPQLDDLLEVEEFSTFQVPYSALERDLEDRIALAGSRGRGVIVRGGVAQGARKPKATWHGGEVSWADSGLQELLDGETVQSFLLRFAISHPAVTTVIVGTATPEHVRSNAQAARRGPLPDDVYQEAQRRLGAAGATAAPPGDGART